MQITEISYRINNRIYGIYIYIYITLLLFADKPTMTELTNFAETLDITKEIGIHWSTVGTTLLNDIHGVILPAIHQQHLGNVQQINLEIMRRWINGEGMEVCSWRTLIDVLHRHDCKALAEQLEQRLSPQRPGRQLPGDSNLVPDNYI